MGRHIQFFTLGWCMVGALSNATAHEFRVETEVTREGDSNPISTSLTLSESGLIYDFLLAADGGKLADEIAIYDTRERRFVLLDVNRRIRTTIHDHQIARLLTALKSTGVIKDEFMVNPVFEESYDLSSRWLTLKSSTLTYRARGSHPHDGALLPVYNLYMDQFARLKATDPRGMPPFARLELNAAIKRHAFIPEEIQLQLQVTEGEETRLIALTSKHNVLWQLSKQDREYIELAKRYWMTFDEVDLRHYRSTNENDNDERFARLQKDQSND